MKNILALCSISLLFLSSLSCFSQTALNTPEMTPKQAEEWFKKKAWAPAGFALNAAAFTDKAEFARQYARNKVLWDKAFAFLKDYNLETLPPGKYPIDSTNVYATVTEGPSKEFDKTNWESHRNYIDLQYVAKGKERIGIVPAASATVTKPYDEAKDVANYAAEGKYFIAEPGTFYLFFPQNAHRPSILVDGYNTVRKVVVKIRVAQ